MSDVSTTQNFAYYTHILCRVLRMDLSSPNILPFPIAFFLPLMAYTTLLTSKTINMGIRGHSWLYLDRSILEGVQ